MGVILNFPYQIPHGLALCFLMTDFFKEYTGKAIIFECLNLSCGVYIGKLTFFGDMKMHMETSKQFCDAIELTLLLILD